jgi:hypothetical protein
MMGCLEDLEKLGTLRDQGLLTADEFDQQKRKILALAPGSEQHITQVSPRSAVDPSEEKAWHLASCQSCGKSASPLRRKCPQCGQTLRRGPVWTVVRWCAWTLIWGVLAAVCAILAIAAITYLGRNAGTEPRSASAGRNQPPTVFKVGDVIHTAQLDAEVTKVSERYSVGSSQSTVLPSEDNMFVVVNLRLKNVTTQTVSSVYTPSVWLMPPDGDHLFRPDARATAAFVAESHSGEGVPKDLRPNAEVRTVNAFEVSRERFNPAIWMIGMIVGDEPTFVAFSDRMEVSARP